MSKLVTIYMRNIPGLPDHRALTKPLACFMPSGSTHHIKGDDEKGFIWNGASVGIFRPIFPKWKHPVATAKHDYRCMMAKTKEERNFADEMFKIDVGKTSWWVTKQYGYAAVRVGAHWKGFKGELR